MERFDPPVFDMVTDWVMVLPTTTDPKLTDGGDNEMAAGVAGGGWFWWPDVLVVPLTPAQPAIERVPRITKTKRYRERRRINPAPLFEGVPEFLDSAQHLRMYASLINGSIVRRQP
jgi:hypothetical protein